MRRLYIYALAGAGLVGVAGVVLAQTGAPVNTPVGSVWTYFGPTFGASWAPPANVAGCTSIVSFGGVGNNTTDNVPAWNAAKAAAVKCLIFPEGTYRFSSGMTYALTTDHQAVTILGAGQDVTVLHFPTAVGTGLAITKNKYNQSVHIRDFTMTTATANVDVGIKVTQTLLTPNVEPTGYAQNDLTRVTFRSSQGYWGPSVTWAWNRAVNLIDESVWDLVGVSVYGSLPGGGYAVSGGTSGNGIVIEGTVPKTTGNLGVPVVFNISRANLNWLENGLLIGNYAQGFQISQSNFVGCFSGIAVPAGMLQLDELAVSTSQFNNMNSINLGATMNMVALVGNIIYVPASGHGLVSFAPLRVAQIVGNSFLGTAVGVGTGLRLDPPSADAAPATVVGNSFYRLATGVKLQNFTDNNVFAANSFYANTAGVDNLATGTANVFTGGIQPLTATYADVSGAANNGAGLVRLTVNSTNGFYNGQMVLVGNVGGIGGAGVGSYIVTPIKVIDATHIDVLNATFSGAYTSGGKVSSLPP